MKSKQRDQAGAQDMYLFVYEGDSETPRESGRPCKVWVISAGLTVCHVHIADSQYYLPSPAASAAPVNPAPTIAKSYTSLVFAAKDKALHCPPGRDILFSPRRAPGSIAYISLDIRSLADAWLSGSELHLFVGPVISLFDCDVAFRSRCPKRQVTNGASVLMKRNA